jgi:hypothetical protein
MSRAVLAAFVGAGVLVLASARAEAYCQKTTCEPEKETCETDEYGCVASGSGVRWKSDTIPYRFHAAGSSRLADEAVRTAMRSAIRRWEDVRCEGGRTSLAFSEENDVRTGVREGRTAPTNFGVYFRDDGWPGGPGELAVTHLDRGNNSGKIVGASIEFNTSDHEFGLEDGAEPDLEAVMVHEIGHYLGLDHSAASGSVMATLYCDGQKPCPRSVAALRELGEDDIAGVCALYPAKRAALEERIASSSGCQLAPSRARDRFNFSPVTVLVACLVGARLYENRKQAVRRR